MFFFLILGLVKLIFLFLLDKDLNHTPLVDEAS